MIASFSSKMVLLGGKNELEDQYLSLMKEYTGITDLLNQNSFASDEICQTMAANVDLWEAYIRYHFYLISNVARKKRVLPLHFLRLSQTSTP